MYRGINNERLDKCFKDEMITFDIYQSYHEMKAMNVRNVDVNNGGRIVDGLTADAGSVTITSFYIRYSVR